MDVTLQKIERLMAEIGDTALGDRTLAELHAALDEVGARLRAQAGLPESARPVAAPSDEVRRLGHDLNNCLGVVGGRAELISIYLDRGRLDEVRRGVDVILGQIERMRALIDRLRSLNRAPGSAS